MRLLLMAICMSRPNCEFNVDLAECKDIVGDAAAIGNKGAVALETFCSRLSTAALTCPTIGEAQTTCEAAGVPLERVLDDDVVVPEDDVPEEEAPAEGTAALS